MSASTDGALRQWHVGSGGRLLRELASPGSETDQLYCVDYTSDGASIVAGGRKELWVFDDETGKLQACLDRGDSFTTVGHSNRVMACRCMPSKQDPWGIVSGGWDNTVQFWDLRVGHAVRAIYGPHIRGDALDVSRDGRVLLTGSWRATDSLELWDMGSGERIQSLDWRGRGLRSPPCFVYAARFSHHAAGNLIAAGGTCAGAADNLAGEAKVLQASDAGPDGSYRCAGALVKFTCLSLHFSSPAASLVAFGGRDGRVRVMRLDGAGGI